MNQAKNAPKGNDASWLNKNKSSNEQILSSNGQKQDKIDT